VEITAKELRQMASTVDEHHREAMRTFREETAELHLDSTRSRRTALKQAGLAGIGGLVLAAAPAIIPTASLLQRAAAAGLTDVDIAVFAESVELAAVAIYTDPDVGSLVSADIAAVAQLFAQHPKDHAGAFGALAGAKATGKANPPIVKIYTDTLKPTVKDQTDVLKLAAVIEHQAASTYAFALTALQSPDAAAGTATILPVEAEHAILLGAALGQTLDELFPGGAFISASVGQLGDPKVGIDPTAYPAA
jgi:hypothetical protein